jgi:hypothetical protein
METDMNASEKTPAEVQLAALLERYEEALSSDAYKSRDCHWQITERWSEGEYLGWFVEHDGYRYGGLDKDYGQDGPHPSHEAALACMAEHLRTATRQAEEDDETEEGSR